MINEERRLHSRNRKNDKVLNAAYRDLRIKSSLLIQVEELEKVIETL